MKEYINKQYKRSALDLTHDFVVFFMLAACVVGGWYL
jgi:hypothetical protein